MKLKKIRKAVFPVAGFGTRFLPATKAMPKELLPIIDKPLIQHAVEEAVNAGIDTLIFVTGKNKRAIEDHFDKNLELELSLQKKEQYEKAEMIQNILPKGVECIFVRQSEQLGLGHAILCAERAVGNEPFVVSLADDFIYCDKPGVTKDLIDAYYQSGKTQLSIMNVVDRDIPKYGIIEQGNAKNKISGLVEKPQVIDAPSNFASIGRYVLTGDIFDILRDQKLGLGGEIQLSDAINTQAKMGNVESILLNGSRFDCGSITGYIQAIIFAAKKENII
jgi:UTP--glucose-1-phosphate uridylyltransferase